MTDLKRTCLYDLHLSLGAKMVPFAGYEMPVQYPMGVLKEHLHTRAAAGLFDVSHMGQVLVAPKSGHIADAAAALERMVPVDVAGLAEGRQRYGFFTDEMGGTPRRNPRPISWRSLWQRSPKPAPPSALTPLAAASWRDKF